MRFKVGDKVRVLNDLEVDKMYGSDYVIPEMVEWLGKIATISIVGGDYYNLDIDAIVSGDYYKLDIDGGQWCWTDEMLEEVGEIEKKKYIKLDIPEWVNWLARESNGDLYGYRNKPNKGVATWCIGPVNVEQINCHLVSDDPNIYPQVKWEDGAAKRYKDGIICVDVEVDDLTDEEIDFINDDQPTVEEGLEMNDVKFDIPEWVNWLARDNNGALYGYRNKPVEGLDMWGVTGDSDDFEKVVVSFITDDLEYYPQVKWNDEEPTRIKDGITLPYEPSELDTNEAITALQSFGNTLTDSEKLRWGLTTVNEIREGTENPPEPDMIQNPPHYKQYSFEPIDIITEVVKEYPPEIGFHIGTTLKYLFRSPFKDNLPQDLAKAEYYLQRANKELTDE